MLEDTPGEKQFDDFFRPEAGGDIHDDSLGIPAVWLLDEGPSVAERARGGHREQNDQEQENPFHECVPR